MPTFLSVNVISKSGGHCSSQVKKKTIMQTFFLVELRRGGGEGKLYQGPFFR